MKKSLSKILSAVLAAVMLVMSAPAANLLKIDTSSLSIKASAYDYEEIGFDYLYNFIDILSHSNVDENGFKYVEYDLSSSFYYVRFTYNSEYDVIEAYFEYYGYIDGRDYVILLITRNNDVYYCGVGSEYYCDDESEDIDYIRGVCTVYGSEYNPYTFYTEVNIIECSPFFDGYYEDNNEFFSYLVINAIEQINYCLTCYAGMDLGYLGFDIYSGFSDELYSTELNGLLRDSFGWKYYTDSEIDYDYEGIADNYFGVWYVRNGGIDFGYTGFAQIDCGDYYDYLYIKNGKADFDYVGLVKDPDDGLWWFVDYGYIDFSYTGLAKNQYGWWYVNNGTIDFTYTGMAKNQYGWWFVENGKLNSKYNGMAKNQYGWWYFSNGKIDYKFNGLAKNQYGWWYIKNGTIDYKFQGLAKNQYGWWYVQNGTINFKYNGYASNQYGTWKVVNGKVVGK